MISERQKKIIKLLQNHNLSVHEIANKLNVSDRTISRDLKAINKELNGIAQIVINGVCHLETKSSLKLYQLLGQGVPDKMRFLDLLLNKEDLSLDDYAEELYLPKAKIKEYISQLNEEYQSVFSIELKQGTGIVLHIGTATKIDLMANILLDYQELRPSNFPSPSLNILEVYKNLAEKYITNDEFISQLMACSNLNLNRISLEKYFKEEKILVLNQIDTNEDGIKSNIIKIFLNNGFEIPDNHILNMCLNHIKRETLFPTILLKNKSDIEVYLKEQPVAFDIAKKISLFLEKEYPIQVNSYYLALYVMLALSTFDNSIYKIVLISRRRSISSINKYIIEDKVKGSQVYVIDSLKEMPNISDNYTTILDSELINTNLSNENVDLIISSLVTEANIEKLTRIVRNKTFSKLLQEVENKYTFDINNYSSDFFETFDQLLKVLRKKDLITQVESNALVNREKAGNQLVIDNYSLPHIISGRKGDFRLFKAKLKIPVVVNKQFIDRILVIIIGTDVTNKSEIFKYLFEVINGEK